MNSQGVLDALIRFLSRSSVAQNRAEPRTASSSSSEPKPTCTRAERKAAQSQLPAGRMGGSGHTAGSGRRVGLPEVKSLLLRKHPPTH